MNKETTSQPASVACFDCQYRERSQWSVLGADEMELLDRTKICRRFDPGEVIFHEGDPCTSIFCVMDGLVGIRKTDAEGNSVLLARMATAGDTLGYRPFLANEAHRGTAEPLKPSTICTIDGKAVHELLLHNPSLGLQFLERAVKDLGEAEEHYFQTVTLSVRARFAHLLLVLKEQYGKTAADGGLSIELPLSRGDLAAMIGARPESMSRTIRKMEDEGIAKFAGRTVHVPRIDQLINELGPGIHF
jgi:CRP/FNR family transcriptional regulator